MDVFGGAPRFLAYPRPVGVQSGADAVLKCQIGGDPRPAVIWERNNEKIDPQGRYRVFEDGNVYNLIITAVTMEDSGQYMCKAKNSIGETYAAATLKVEGEAQELELREENKPRFLIKPLSTRAGRGEDAVFSCKLWGSPRPEVTWEKDGRKLSEIFESTHFSVSYQDGGWFQLKIFKTRAPDGGVYTCKARNEFGEALAGAVLLVDAGPGHEEDANRNGYTNGHRKSHQGKQRLSRQMPNQHKDQMTTKSTRVKMFAVTEGKHAKFRCFVTGKPKPEIIWRKDGRLILSGRRYLLYEDREGYFTLKVLYCKQKDNGVYVCAASNTAGQTLSAVHLSVKEPPVRFKQPLIDLEVWERDLAVLECEVPEDSVPITWYLEDRRLQPGAKYGMEEWGTKRRLTIRDIGVDDDGIYLCEMPDGGRSIAEVAVKGPIMRKLPRKVDVLEGENAAFCVEVEKEEMDIHWYKDGVELRETHQTILKSFGRTHILVFVNTMPQDSGFVTFFVGRSKTSSQLRVKAAKHCPPSCPVGVQINTERANAALLSWTPAQDSRKNPPSGYVLERQEVGTGSQEWLQCLTTDSATSVEILGDSVPCEADYRFRICSVNKYGKSNNVEFPRAVHLVPVARIQTPLQDALVPEGQDAVFTIELSASVIGSWFLNGTQLQDDERFAMRRSRTHQSLRIQGVRDTENGTEITFIAYGIRDSAALYIQAPLVKFSLLSEMDRNKFVEIGNPIVLYCELSDPAALVHWYKNGVKLQTTDGLHIQSEGTMRRIVIQSAEFSHSGVYCCDAIDDVIRFNVEVEAPSVRFSAIPEAARNKTIHTGSQILLRCELSDHDAQVQWYKDGSKLFPQNGVNIQADGLVRKLVIPSAEFYHSGLYCCKTKGDSVTFNVNIKAPPVKFYPLPEEMRAKSIEAGNPVVLQCVVSDPETHVCWYKDGTPLISSSDLEIQSDGTARTLVVQAAELHHSGVYRCTTKDDTVDFQVEIKAKPAKPSNNFEVKRAKSFEMGEPLVLECEVADSTLPAQWYKDGVKLFPHKEQDIQSNGTLRRLIVPSAELAHVGQYNCETSTETVHFTVDMKAPSAPLSPLTKFVEKQPLEAPCSFEPPHQISDPENHCPRQAKGSLQKDEATVSNSEQDFGMEDLKKTLVIEPSHPSNSGAYYWATADDVAPLVVTTPVPAVTCGQDVARATSAEECCPIVQQFEISDPVAKACWYKDGTPVHPKMETLSEPESSIQAFPLPVTLDLHGVANLICETSSDAQLNVDIKEQCLYGGEIGEVSDASAQITADIKAALPRFASEQEKINSTDAECIPSKRKSGSSSGERRDSLIYEAHSTTEATLPSTNEYTTEGLLTKDKNEHNNQHKNLTVKSQSDCNPIKPSIMKFDTHGHTRHLTESQGEESFIHIQKTEDPEVSEQFITSLQTAVTSGVCKSQRCTNVESEESNLKNVSVQLKEHCSTVPSAVPSDLGNLQKTSAPQPRHFTNRIETVAVQLDRCCDSVRRPHTDKPFRAMQSTKIQAAEPRNSTEMSDFLTNNLLNSIQTKLLISDNHSNSIRTDIYQSEEISTLSSAKTEMLDTPPCLSMELCDSQHPEIVQPTGTKLLISGIQSKTIWSDLYQSEEISTPSSAKTEMLDTPPCLSMELYDSQHPKIVQPTDTKLLISENQSKTIRSDLYQSEEISTPSSAKTEMLDTPPCLSMELYNSQHPKIVQPMDTKLLISENQSKTIRSDLYQSEEISTVSSTKTDMPDTTPCLSMELFDSQHPEIVQQRDNSHFHIPFVGPNDVSQTKQAVTNKQYQSLLETTVLTAHQHNTEAEKDQMHVILNSGQGSSTQFSASACFEQTTNVQSEGSSPSRTCGSHTNVTARKVAVEAPPVTISTLCQTERIKSAEVDEPAALPVVLPCELSTPNEVVTQHDEGVRLHKEASQDPMADGSVKEPVMCSAGPPDVVVDSCETKVEAKPFPVDFKVPLQTFSAMKEAEQKQSVMAGCPVTLQCELSDPDGQVTWFKDGTRLLPQTGIDIQSKDNLRSLVILSTEVAHSGVYHCKSKDDDIQYTVEVKALPAKFSELQEADKNKTVQEGCAIVLTCELSRDSAVDWYKDGLQLHQQNNLEIQTEGRRRTLFIPLSETTHGGTYKCATSDDTITFKVNVKGRLPHIMPVPQSEKHRMIAAGSPIILQCEVSDPVAQVSWFKDEADLFCKTGLDMKRNGSLRKLIIHSAKRSDSGLYGCKLAEDVVTFHVDVQAAPVRFAAIPDRERNKLVEAGCPVKMQCEVSEPTAQVQWHKNGGQLLPKSDFEITSEETFRALVIKSAQVRHSGVYSCDSSDDHIEFKVDVAAVPEVKGRQAVEAGNTEKKQCKGSDSTGSPGLHEDGIKHFPKSATKIDSEGLTRTPDLDSAVSSVSGEYSCKSDHESESNDCYAEVKAPPVTFVEVPEEELFKSAVENSELGLSCEVSRDDAVVQWYKDGAEIQPSSNITMRAEATKRHLAIQSAQLSDSGTYTCRAGDNAVMFKVNIREPPVMIVYPKEDVRLERHVPEEIILSCELSRPNGVVSWYKDGQKLQKSENIKLKVEGPYRRLKILTSRVEDSGEYVCDTADDSIFFNLSITEPPVRIVSPSQSQMELCQQMSERMVLSCEISRPNAVVRWYRDGLEVEESDNLILEVDGVYRRLIIPETTVKDSAEYVCDTTDDSMTFFVNIAEPPVRFVRPRKIVNRLEKVLGESLVLDCEVSRPNAVVLWKRNGEEVEDSNNVTVAEDGVVRQLTVHSLTIKDVGIYVCDAKDDVMDFHVKVKELPIQIIGKTDAKTEKQFLVSDDIILVCELSRPNASATWYKNGQPIDETERYCSEEQGVFRSLVVLNASLEDSGEYTCDAVDDKMVFHITVAEPPVKIVGNSGHPEHHILLAGEELILECEVSRPNATVQWLRNGEILKPDTRVKIYSHDVMRKLVLSGLQPSDSGKYVCDAADDKLITIVEVQEIPVKFVNKKATNKILAYENESVTLCAVVSRDKANVRWLKDGQLLNKDNIHISSEGNTHKLTINPLQLSDSGDYVCDANTDDMYFSLFVKEMKVKFIRPLENLASLKGSSLTLRCEINKPKGDVQWLRDGREISPSRRYRIRAQGRERSFTIFEALEEDAGEYACESTDDRTSATVTVNTPRVVEFIAELRNITVCEREDAVFKCVVSPADAQLVWRLNGKQVALNERSVASSNGLCHMLCIRNCVLSDSGIVTADAEGLLSKAELQVQEQQVTFTKKMLPVTAEEYGDAALEVEVSHDCREVQWMRQGVLIHPGAKYTLKHEGRKHSLTIHKLAPSDRGSYSCESLHDCTQAQLTVEPRNVTIKKGLSDLKTMERETATLEVELSHPNVGGTWWRNGSQLKLTSHFRMSAKGHAHSLTICNLSVEDTATFMFCAGKLKTSARLVVKEPPVTIFRKLEEQKIPEGSVVSIECELSRPNVDVKWMKNGVEVKPGKNVRVYTIGRKRFLQITKCLVSDSGMYTCDAGEAATSATVEVYERELLVVQGLEDLSIGEDQNAVFVCEISVEDVPGEWYKNGQMIHQTSTIKTRQEGTKHFLLMCNVRPEDSGEIKFAARHVDSVAKLQVKEIPLSIVKPLQDKTALEKSRVMLDCTVSNPRCSIRWYKGSNVILPSERFEISSEGCYRKLIIQQVALDDQGTYSMQVGEYTCSAKLTVEAQPVVMVRELRDFEVAAPSEAVFECEVSSPAHKPPTWSLNGEPVQPGAQVRLEKLGTVHRLTLKQTSTGMNGLVAFTCGEAKSSAQLTVLTPPAGTGGSLPHLAPTHSDSFALFGSSV
ncbi:obscurin-like isoform X2 [Vanacampus margaritifer]